MDNQKSTDPRPRSPKPVRVEMRQTVAGPDGILERGYTYDLPRDDTEYWIVIRRRG